MNYQFLRWHSFVQVKPPGNSVINISFYNQKTLQKDLYKATNFPIYCHRYHQLKGDPGNELLGFDPWMIKGQIPADPLIIICFLTLFLLDTGNSWIRTVIQDITKM